MAKKTKTKKAVSFIDETENETVPAETTETTRAKRKYTRRTGKIGNNSDFIRVTIPKNPFEAYQLGLSVARYL